MMNMLIHYSHLKIVNLSFHLFIFCKSFLQAIFGVQVWILPLIYVAKNIDIYFNLLLLMYIVMIHCNGSKYIYLIIKYKFKIKNKHSLFTFPFDFYYGTMYLYKVFPKLLFPALLMIFNKNNRTCTGKLSTI